MEYKISQTWGGVLIKSSIPDIPCGVLDWIESNMWHKLS